MPPAILFTPEQVPAGHFAIPQWGWKLFQPMRYKVLEGGRGSAKSETVARVLLQMGLKKRLKVLCAREFQISINESVHATLKELIEMYPRFERHYTVQRNTIIGKNGTVFIFAGIKTNIKKIKSMQGVDICWVEEADAVSEESWSILIPTIRKPGSEIWVTFNPDLETDPTSIRFITNPDPSRMMVLEVNWRDNPWFPVELEKERLWDMKVDPEAAMHTWEGKFRSRSKASILGDKYRVMDFVPAADWDGPYYGADWGFAQDPDTLVKCWRDNTRLYIEKAAGGIAIPQNDIPKLWLGTVPECKDWPIRADNSRPETIFHVNAMGFPGLQAAEKWPGSVEDGIRWLRSFEEIVIHSSCKRVIAEFQNYKYKTDPRTNDILPIIIDKHNHYIDAIRYAFEPQIKVAEHEKVLVYDRQVPIDPDLDEFELRQELEAW